MSQNMDSDKVMPTSPVASQMPTQPPSVHRNGPYSRFTAFDNIIWWSDTARRPLGFLTQEQQAVIDQCEYLRAIQRYSIRNDFYEYRYPSELQRQFGHSCEVGCICESSPIYSDNDIPSFEINSSNDDSDGDTQEYINSQVIITDDDGNLYEPETDTQPDESPTQGS